MVKKNYFQPFFSVVGWRWGVTFIGFVILKFERVGVIYVVVLFFKLMLVGVLSSRFEV